MLTQSVSFRVGSQDVVVKHKTNGLARSNRSGGKRGAIRSFSPESINRLKLAIRNCPEGSLQFFLTLTYPKSYPVDGRVVKRHLELVRKWLSRNGCSAIWFLEFQSRGAPHFHMFLDCSPAAGLIGIASFWHDLVGSGDANHLQWHLGKLPRSKPCLMPFEKPYAASAYATKYASKLEQKEVPSSFHKVGRFWGVFGSLRPQWQEIPLEGSDGVAIARGLVTSWRDFIDPECNGWRPDHFLSTVMWGAAGFFPSLLEESGFSGG